MSANDAQRTESIYNISDFEFFEIGEFTTEAQSRRVGEESISPQRTQRGEAATKKNRNISRKDAKAQSKKDFRTWRSWRLGARNIRIREFLDAKNLRVSRKF